MTRFQFHYFFKRKFVAMGAVHGCVLKYVAVSAIYGDYASPSITVDCCCISSGIAPSLPLKMSRAGGLALRERSVGRTSMALLLGHAYPLNPNVNPNPHPTIMLHFMLRGNCLAHCRNRRRLAASQNGLVSLLFTARTGVAAFTPALASASSKALPPTPTIAPFQE